VLTKIDEILTWEKQKDAERDTRSVELGRYLCAVLASGKHEIVRRVPGKTVSRVAKESVLPDVNSRTLATAGKKGTPNKMFCAISRGTKVPDLDEENRLVDWARGEKYALPPRLVHLRCVR
jgi:hypothetical protein